MLNLAVTTAVVFALGIMLTGFGSLVAKFYDGKLKEQVSDAFADTKSKSYSIASRA